MSPDHLIIAPILIPFLAGTLMLFYEDRQRNVKMTISILSAVALLVVAILLLAESEGSRATGGNDVGVYLLGNWPTTYAINLVLDRLSALMLLLTACLALPAITYSGAGWQSKGRHFHSLFQFLLMGLNGAFLTGDLFNLFVFFEVMLAASYGLLLHGSGRTRVGSGLFYITVNLASSLLFLIGVAMLYGVAGTLNMADLAVTIPSLPEADRPLLLTAATLLGIVFVIKAGIWPLAFWLPGAYMAAAAPVGAIFAVMTKVGLYVILRLTLLLFGNGAEVAPAFGAELLTIAGLCTIAFGSIGTLSSQGMPRVASYAVLTSSGTVLAAFGIAALLDAPVLASALYYMVGSTIAVSALFLLAELMERDQGAIANLLAVTADAYGFGDEDLDDEEDDGAYFPGAQVLLALTFSLVTLMLAGLPPLAGFLGKFAMISQALKAGSTALVWVFVAALILSGLATLVALVRIGINTFWVGTEPGSRIRAQEMAPILALVTVTLLLTVQAAPSLRYLRQTAEALSDPRVYISGVLNAQQSAGFALQKPEDLPKEGLIQ